MVSEVVPKVIPMAAEKMSCARSNTGAYTRVANVGIAKRWLAGESRVFGNYVLLCCAMSRELT